MKQITIVRYCVEMRERWDALVDESRNGTFLFRRDYMEYHAHRFVDYSLCFFYGDKLIAVLPAHRDGDVLYSHGGLTYGGLVLSVDATQSRVLAIFDMLVEYLRKEGFVGMIYKCVPYHLQKYPADEARYALFRHGATQLVCNVATVVDMSMPIRMSELRRRGARKAQRAGIVIAESDDYSHFWTVLIQNLQTRYSATPVHSLEEIIKLSSLFPENIRLFVAKQDNEILGGTVVYECGKCVRVQYISADERGKELSVLDLLFSYLLTERYIGYKYFDFGTSNEAGGHYLNEGLIAQKEGFGGRAVIYETYELKV